MKNTISIAIIASLIWVNWPAVSRASENTPGRVGEIARLRRQALELIPPLPEKAPAAEKDSAALVELGRKLFFEKRLSINQTQSCNSCHAVDRNLGGVDNEPTSPGALGQRGGRNSPTVLNAAFHTAQFWDGRAATLEDQAKGPVLNPIEMAMPNEEEVLKRLKALSEYRAGFVKAFPKPAEPITYENQKDLGRYAVTKDDDDKFKFKVPSLRNVALTSPYFHDGSQATLEQAVRKMGWLQLGKELTDGETKSLVAFLGALNDKARAAKGAN